jgi:hypothetical protein
MQSLKVCSGNYVLRRFDDEVFGFELALRLDALTGAAGAAGTDPSCKPALWASYASFILPMLLLLIVLWSTIGSG